MNWKTCPTHGPEKPAAWGCPECVREQREEITALRAEVAALRKDAERLNFMNANPWRVKRSIGYRESGDSWVICNEHGQSDDFYELRAAIDAARKETP